MNIEIGTWLGYICCMTLYHPKPDQIDLANVLTALGDETRLAMLGYLASNNELEMACGAFHRLGSKTALSYHLAKLREAGFLDAITPSAVAAAERQQTAAPVEGEAATWDEA